MKRDPLGTLLLVMTVGFYAVGIAMLLFAAYYALDDEWVGATVCMVVSAFVGGLGWMAWKARREP